MNLEIVTSEQTVFTGSVDYVSVNSVDGRIGILPNHISLISELNKGNLMWRYGDKEKDITIILRSHPSDKTFDERFD